MRIPMPHNFSFFYLDVQKIRFGPSKIIKLGRPKDLTKRMGKAAREFESNSSDWDAKLIVICKFHPLYVTTFFHSIIFQENIKVVFSVSIWYMMLIFRFYKVHYFT